jgi:phage shock protein E
MTSLFTFLVILALAVGYMFLKRSGQVSSKEAAEYLKSGAMLIDVRSPNEFEAGHIMQAYNMPVDRIEMVAPTVVKQKNKILLLHCSTGVRSNAAKKKLEGLGYTKVFNIGSYERAEKLVVGR